MKKSSLLLLFLLFFLPGFSQKSISNTNEENESRLKILPVLWQQTAAEYRALCYQAFNLATIRIDALSKSKIKKEKMAIITDLDETILDNSRQTGQLIRENQVYSKERWNEWTDLEAANALPGAVEFLVHAQSRGLTVYYVSNRKTNEVETTIANLKKLGIPFADKEHMLFKENERSKESRRQAILKNHTVIMLMGDNLNDFLACFEETAFAVRNTRADSLNAEWGKKFIVLPNCTYGEWEDVLYRDLKKQTLPARDSVRMGTIKGYK